MNQVQHAAGLAAFSPLVPAGPDPVTRLRVEAASRLKLGPLDLALRRSECVCLSGSSGAGKSLLLRSLADMDPHQGRLYLDGTPREQFTGPAWRRRVALLPPESAWWADRVGTHFTCVDEHLLADLGLEPEVMDWSVERLSSGERQRLALARMLCNRPAVLLLDEPTANLDPTNIRRVEALVARYREQATASVLWVSHDPAQIARLTSRHLRVEAGGLAEVFDP